MSGVTMVTDALPHSLTGLWGSQARKVEIKIVSSWLRGMKFIKVNGKSKDAMTKMSLFVGKLFEPSAASECSCFVRCYHNETVMISRCLRQWSQEVKSFPEDILLPKDFGSNQISSPFSPYRGEDTLRKVYWSYTLSFLRQT